MDLYPCVNGSDPRMHRTLTPRPRWYRPLKRSMNLASRLASWELVAGSEALCSHAHAHDDNDDTYVEEQELGRQTSSEADA